MADAETAEQVNDAVDMVGYVIHLLFQTASYSLLIDDSHKSNDPGAAHEQTVESLVWIAGIFDQGDSSVISAAGLVTDPVTKQIILGCGMTAKATAFATQMIRTTVSALVLVDAL